MLPEMDPRSRVPIEVRNDLVMASRDSVRGDAASADCRGTSPPSTFAVCFWFQLRFSSAPVLLQHGESVARHPAAAAGREEGGREGGGSPQTWVDRRPESRRGPLLPAAVNEEKIPEPRSTPNSGSPTLTQQCGRPEVSLDGSHGGRCWVGAGLPLENADFRHFLALVSFQFNV